MPKFDIKNKKILIIINDLSTGGAQRIVIDDINEMISRGFLVKLLTLKNERPGSMAV